MKVIFDELWAFHSSSTTPGDYLAFIRLALNKITHKQHWHFTHLLSRTLKHSENSMELNSNCKWVYGFPLCSNLGIPPRSHRAAPLISFCSFISFRAFSTYLRHSLYYINYSKTEHPARKILPNCRHIECRHVGSLAEWAEKSKLSNQLRSEIVWLSIKLTKLTVF